MRDAQITLDAKRVLAYSEIGEPGWPCLFFFHGAPSSRLRLGYLEDRFLARRVRVVSIDRPAYGGSSPRPKRSMLDWPADVTAVADTLGVDTFMVAGHSSGGPYAVACAAVLNERVSACISLGGVTDMGWGGAWENYLDNERLLMRLPDERAALDWCEEQFAPDGSGFMAASGFELSQPDELLYEDPQVAPQLHAARAEAFRQGVAGYAQDIFVQGRPWPFDPGAVRAPTQVLHGELDTLVPATHSRHTCEIISGASLRMLAGHGHFTILGELPHVAESLASSLGLC